MTTCTFSLSFGNFNPRPSVRGDLVSGNQVKAEINFNPRPSVRGDTPRMQVIAYHEHFNPRPSVRGDSKCFLIS